TEVARDDAEARKELTDLQKRQADWTHLMEQQLNDRTAALQEVVGRVESLAEQRISSIRGLGHDLKNPLQALMTNAQLLSERQDGLSDLQRGAVADLGVCVERMEQMLADLL